MKVGGKNYRTVWMDGGTVYLIDQNLLPFEFRIMECTDHRQTIAAIKNMNVRGAGAIGAAAGFAMAQAVLSGADPRIAREEIEASRPTARNLFYAVEKVFAAGSDAFSVAQSVAEEDVQASRAIGIHGEKLIRKGMRIATHCNAGWLAFVDHGTALAPIYEAKARGKDPFVFVDETRPRGQGARLTAWELINEEIRFAVIPDNAFAFYAAKGDIDMVITGADRIARNGDTANKIGTLEKAIVSKQYGIPFYIAAPFSTFDAGIPGGKNIPIEFRGAEEVTHQSGMDSSGSMHTIRVVSPGAEALNPAFDVTPVEFISGYITEKGILNSFL